LVASDISSKGRRVLVSDQEKGAICNFRVVNAGNVIGDGRMMNASKATL
jgi:hypothetical protein